VPSKTTEFSLSHILNVDSHIDKNYKLIWVISFYLYQIMGCDFGKKIATDAQV
jgi:hypothetical protein